MFKILRLVPVMAALALASCGGGDAQKNTATVPQPPIVQKPGGPGSPLSPTPTATSVTKTKGKHHRKKHKAKAKAVPKSTATVDPSLPTYTATPQAVGTPLKVNRTKASVTVSSSTVRVAGGALAADRDLVVYLKPSGLGKPVTVTLKSGGETLGTAALSGKGKVPVAIHTPASGSVRITAGSATVTVPVQ